MHVLSSVSRVGRRRIFAVLPEVAEGSRGILTLGMSRRRHYDKSRESSVLSPELESTNVLSLCTFGSITATDTFVPTRSGLLSSIDPSTLQTTIAPVHGD
jgi:hypothetical protein